MKKIALVLATASALLLAAATPAAAHQGHTSCAAFGAETREFGGDLGALASGLASSGPNALSDVVAAEHAAFCAQ